MSFTNPAQRDWHQSNHEATHTLDARYGTKHRPGVEPVGVKWAPVCGCPDPKCTRADDDSRRTHDTWGAAWHAADHNLRENEHGPGMETTA